MLMESLKKLMRLILEKKGSDPVILDMRKTPIPTDYFVVVTANSRVHMRTLRDSIVEFLKLNGLPLIYYDKGDEYEWLLIDAGDVVIHIFTERGREFYDLEGLWIDADRIKF